MSSQWLDIDCIVLHQSDGSSNEFTWLSPNFVLVLKVWDMMM